MRPVLASDALAAWCQGHFGVGVEQVLFESGYLSAVTGLRLEDGREVVVKARPFLQRLGSCFRIQKHARAAGFACPEPLVAPSPAGELVLSAEAYVPGGTQLPEVPERPRLFAEALAELVGVCSTFAQPFSLEPPPAWVWWDHDLPGLWPPPDDRIADLNQTPHVWLDGLGQRARWRLRRDKHQPVIGHSDWWQPNLAWQDTTLHVVHDWDSLAFLSEAAIAGAAASTFSVSDAGACSVEEGEAFLSAYERARGRAWSRDEREVAWAAGLWLLGFNARKESLQDNSPALEALRLDGAERLRLASV
jgi:hypothetical protein